MSMGTLQPEAGDDRQPFVEIEKLERRWAISAEYDAAQQYRDCETISGHVGRSILRPYQPDLFEHYSPN